ncbi:soluble calcium-activated nucleotidase 1-like isoform X2 [Tubulanus polymorphus]
MMNHNNPVGTHSWMNTIKAPLPWQINTTSIRVKKRAFILLVGAAVVLILIWFLNSPKVENEKRCFDENIPPYNNHYPLSQRVKTENGFLYKIAIISDLDQESRNKTLSNTWFSYIKYGRLFVHERLTDVSIKWDEKIDSIVSHVGSKGRGMELSELIVFNGRVYTCDDRTGIVYEIHKKHVVPWVILSDGNGLNEKGFKCEWMAVKDESMFVGGLGKEWTTSDGELVNLDPQWVKRIEYTGAVTHIDWHHNYNAMRRAAGFSYPGYIIHESGVWSDIHKRWFFLPRRASKQRYSESVDEFRATNILITCDEQFNNIDVRHIGPFSPVRGYSSFKFIPDTNDQLIVAIKSEEERGKIGSYIVAFDLKGNVLLTEMKIEGNFKFEGIEFL